MTTRQSDNSTTSFSLNRNILRLALPNIITNITVPLLGLVDLALMGHLGNPVYIGAIALGSIVFSLLYTGFGFLRMGTSGFTAQEFGAKNQQGMSLILWRSLLVGLGLGVLFILLQKPIEIISFQLLDGSKEVRALAIEYFRVRIWAAPATLGLYALYGWFLGMQDAKIPMVIAISINLINIVLDFVFVYWLNMTSAGVATASVIAQYSGLLLAGFFFLMRYKQYHIRFSFNRIVETRALKRFFGVNGDIFIRTIMLWFVLAFFTSRSAKAGNNILAVNTLLFQLFYFFSYFADGFAYAAEALTGKAKGAHKLDEMKAVIKSVFRWGWVIALSFTLIYGFGLNPIMKILSDNQLILSMAKPYYFWIIIMPLISIAAFNWDGIFIGATASRAMRNISIIVSLLVFLPAYYLTHTIWGNHGLWFAFDMFMIARGIGMWFYAKRGVLQKEVV